MNNFFNNLLVLIVGHILLSFIKPNKKQVKKIKDFTKFLLKSLPHKKIYDTTISIVCIMILFLGFIAGIDKFIETANIYISSFVFSLFLFTSSGYLYFNLKFSKNAFN